MINKDDLCDKWNHIFCVDISCAKYKKLKLSIYATMVLPNMCNENANFQFSNKEFNIFLFRNPLHPSAHAITFKKINI